MGNTIDISQLKSGATPPTPDKNEGKNIDGKDLRDFGDGLKEFDPTANGFEPEKVEFGKSDKDKALEACDAMFDRMDAEVAAYNDLLEMNGGVVTEEELREHLGQQGITKWLQDGKGQKFEEKPEQEISETQVTDDQATTPVEEKTSSELDELERELEEDYDLEDTQQPVQEEPVKETKSTVYAIKEAGKASADHVHTPLDDMPEPKEPEVRYGTIIGVPGTNPKATGDDKLIGHTPATNTNTAAYKLDDTIKATVGNATGTINIAERKSVSDGESQEDKDLAALDDDYEPPVDDFEEKLKAELAKKIKPVTKRYDLSSMTVAAKPISVNNAITNIGGNITKTFKWPLLHSNRPVVMKGYSAKELNDLSNLSSDNGNPADVFKNMWEHLAAGKGQDFRTWTKCTSYYDVNHIWFAIYGACFKDTNYVPYSCGNCNELMVSTDIPVEKMVKFDSDKVKEKFNQIMSMPLDPNMGNIQAKARVQISDTLVADFSEPSIYDAVIMPNNLDAEFRQKYNDVIGLMSYLDDLYIIRDFGNGPQLSPISIKEFRDNEVKQVKAKIIQYAKIIRSLPSDQYNIILATITSMNEAEDMSYQLPAVSCEHCGKEIPSDINSAYDLVFLRHRLALLGA